MEDSEMYIEKVTHSSGELYLWRTLVPAESIHRTWAVAEVERVRRREQRVLLRKRLLAIIEKHAS